MTPHWRADTLHGQAANRTIVMRNVLMCMRRDPRKENGMTYHAILMQIISITPQLFFVKRQAVKAIEESGLLSLLK